ncbi:MAG: class I SAM-dependent methyltransferase [Candidatus Omnitrophota bacterium]|jgi:2-polyprenyl-3-methyl-5-hydroxy-6-metoxy-1,4-benzoquinol methylase
MADFGELSRLAARYGYDANHNLRYMALAQLVKSHDIKDILILGCGKGILEYILPEEVRCTSIDIDQRAIEIAREINKEKRNRNFIVADIFRVIDVLRKQFDGVIVSEVIEHVEDDKRVLDIARQFMKPQDSLFILTVPNLNRFRNKIHTAFGGKIEFMSDSHIREYNRGDIANLLIAAGFWIIKTDYVYFRFPKECLIRPFIGLNSLLRKIMLKVFRLWADYIIVVSVMKQDEGRP